MPDKKPVLRQSPRVILATAVPADYAERMDAAADTLQITRSRLIVMALNAAVPVLLAQAARAAQQQQQG